VYVYYNLYMCMNIGTFLIVEGLMKVTGTDSIRSLLEVLATWASSAGWQVSFPCILGFFSLYTRSLLTQKLCWLAGLFSLYTRFLFPVY
jgi:hypothetical protein